VISHPCTGIWRRTASVAILFAVVLAMSLPAAVTFASDDGVAFEEKDKRERRPAAFTLNRVRLYVINARRGEPRVFLPPLHGHHPSEAVSEAVTDASRAIDVVRARYDFENLEIVSQSYYLLQAVRTKGGQYTYQLNPEPGWGPYSSNNWQGDLEALTGSSDLEIKLNIAHDRREVFSIQMAVDPGRPLSFGTRLTDDNAVFAVLTFDTPDSSPYLDGNGSTAPVMSTFGPDATGNGSITPSPRIYLNWDLPPTLIHYSPPDYPEIARRAGVEGHVTFHVVIGTDGTVEQVKVSEQIPANRHRIFEKAAEAAVMQWRYRPASINDVPVRALVSQTVQFVLSESGWSYYWPTP
jgi:TonB family protein